MKIQFATVVNLKDFYLIFEILNLQFNFFHTSIINNVSGNDIFNLPFCTKVIFKYVIDLNILKQPLAVMILED